MAPEQEEGESGVLQVSWCLSPVLTLSLPPVQVRGSSRCSCSAPLTSPATWTQDM